MRAQVLSDDFQWWPADCVYFIQAQTEEGLIKIGYTRDLGRRFATLATSSPVPLRLIGYIPHAADLTEGALHAHFHADRLHGEWFRPSRDLVAFATGKASINVGGRLRHDE